VVLIYKTGLGFLIRFILIEHVEGNGRARLSEIGGIGKDNGIVIAIKVDLWPVRTRLPKRSAFYTTGVGMGSDIENPTVRPSPERDEDAKTTPEIPVLRIDQMRLDIPGARFLVPCWHNCY
jgi:hypothetical protein